ncbi:MAG: serine hydrolase [Bacteroidota bacterium]
MLKAIIAILGVIFFIPTNLLDSELEDRFRDIDENFSGNIGVYVKDLKSDKTVDYNADRDWYLASTIKIPLAIDLLQRVEAGEISLDDELVLEESDYVDGSGDLQNQEPGTTYTVLELIENMIKDSDSTATDMLIRLLGEEKFNERIRNNIVADIHPVTTILQVRYDAYGKLHKRAANLSNLDYMDLKTFSPLSERLEEFIRLIEVEKSELKQDSIVDAFETYYQSKKNSGKLTAMGTMIERLAEGELLNEEHTELLIDIMTGTFTGDNRIKAGLPDGADFAHKTGTQIGRSCNIGLMIPEGGDHEDGTVVATCSEKYGPLQEAEEAMAKVGQSLSDI